MLRHRADVRTLGFVAASAACYLAQWATESWLLLPLTCFLAWVCAVISHNMMHAPVFRRRWANRVLQVVVSCCYGSPLTEFVPAHNLSHHRYAQQPEDVMRTSRVRFRWNLLNLLAFFWVVIPGVVVGNGRFKRAMRGRIPLWHRQWLIEASMSLALKAAVLCLDWRKGLAFVLLPQFLAVWGINTVNFLQHDGTEPDHPANHSRNFVSPLFNWFHLNNGFHGIHHVHPGLHWSLLPEAHARELAPVLRADLAQPSLIAFCFRAFIWPGRRGHVPPPAGDDVDWVTKLS